MFAKLAILFTAIPILELFVLIPLGQKIGTGPTIGIVVATALLGALLGRVQGASAWRRIKRALGSGQLPSDAILDGLAVLVAAALLVTPGILTDITGLLLLIPVTRAPLKALAKRKFDAFFAHENAGFFGASMAPPSFFEDLDPGVAMDPHPDDVVIDIDPQKRHKSTPRSPQKLEVVD